MLTLALPLLFSLPAIQDPVWDHRSAEHLLNRAGFGSPSAQVDHWVEQGREALVDHLLKERAGQGTWKMESTLPSSERLAEMERAERQDLIKELRRAGEREATDYVATWIDQMVEGTDPLGDRMTLFWQGFFTSSLQTVRRGDLMIRQHEALREGALGNYGSLLETMVLNPAMLVYLDNNSNRRRKPNENLARELLELFSLGEGNYTEKDVKEAARILTGHAVTLQGGNRFTKKNHDYGRKELLGREGRFEVPDLVRILLEQDACPRWVAGRLLVWFEGLEPSEERLAHYAEILRSNNYEMRPFLRTLFMDPEFYRSEVIGGRVLSPLDYMVGSCRRLGIKPVSDYIYFTSGLLGEKAFFPPNVKGWEGGMSWITTGSLMQRGNLIGVMLGLIKLDDLTSDAELDEMLASAADEEMDMDQGDPDSMMDQDSMEPSMEGAVGSRRSADLVRAMRSLRNKVNRKKFTPPATRLRRTLAMQKPGSDQDLVQAALRELLAIEPPADTAAGLVEFVKTEREALGLSEDRFLRKGGQDAEYILRRLAHLILSLPEAQLG
jgi:uncharacterized protein (DUF1800 family)